MKYISENYPTRMPLEEVSEKLSRTVRSIQRKAQEMGISRPRKKVDLEKKRERQRKAFGRYYQKYSKKVYLMKSERRKKIKLELISIKGNRCEKCGYDRCVAALEFHHDGEAKDGDLAHMIKNGSKQKALKEIEKCILLCANCHRELHNKGASDNVSLFRSSRKGGG